MSAERKEQVKALGLATIEQVIQIILGDGPERSSIFGGDVMMLHAVVEKSELDVSTRFNPGNTMAQKFRKLNVPPKKTTSNMLWVMDRVGKVAAICVDPELFGNLQKHCKEAFHAGTGGRNLFCFVLWEICGGIENC